MFTKQAIFVHKIYDFKKETLFLACALWFLWHSAAIQFMSRDYYLLLLYGKNIITAMIYVFHFYLLLC